MATFNVEIDLSSAAFEDSSELSRILRDLADRVQVQVINNQVAYDIVPSERVRDNNGNLVGRVRLSGVEDES